MYTKPVDLNKPHTFGGPGKKLLSGGVNYDPLPWSDFFDRKETLDGLIPLYIAGTKGHVFLCLHGAGHSALSFASLAKHLKHDSTVISFDFRGHGDHFCDNETDLSEQTLINDTITVFKHITDMFHDASIILVGHSMGGSIATKASMKIMSEYKGEEWHAHLQGLFVIDVVEGSAMDALPFMESIVLSRPPEFKSLQSVVQYGVKSGTVKDVESARVSMPHQVVSKTDQASGVTKYVWRTNLMASKPYWEGWFKGLTKCFLEVRVPKQLLLAGSDRMDKELTIA
jgi:protein phosphatase methylesterase 1